MIQNDMPEQEPMNIDADMKKVLTPADLAMIKPPINYEANGYKSCKSCGGKMVICCCFCCSVCQCGCNIVIVREGQVFLLKESGKFTRKLGPGLHTYNPCTDEVIKCETRAQIMNINKLSLLTKDNVTVGIDCFCQYKVILPELAHFKVQNYQDLISYMTQGALKSIVAESTLSELLANRKLIEKKLTMEIDEKTDPYGLKVLMIGTQKIELPREMERAMATVAESEKQKEAKIIDAQANLESAK